MEHYDWNHCYKTEIQLASNNFTGKKSPVPVFTGVDPLDFNELTPLFSRELTPSISLS